jgi:hypothetical protein
MYSNAGIVKASQVTTPIINLIAKVLVIIAKRNYFPWRHVIHAIPTPIELVPNTLYTGIKLQELEADNLSLRVQNLRMFHFQHHGVIHRRQNNSCYLPFSEY